MRGALTVLLLTCLAGLSAGAVSAKTSSHATPEAHARALPVVAAVAGELVDQPTEDLQRYRRALLTRLLLDQGRVAVTGPQSLHDALVLAAVSLVLGERPKAEDDEALMLARATYVMHAAGHAHRTRPDLRAAISELQKSARKGPTRALFAQLAESAEGLEALGRRWFPEALHAAVGDKAHARETNLLRGLWLEREGRLGQAAQAIGEAVADRATVASTIDLIRVFAHDGKVAAARALAKRLEAKAPGAGGVLAAVLKRAEDATATRAFERSRAPMDTAARLAQTQRYARLDRISDAQGLLGELVSKDLGHAGVFEVAAGLYLRWRRLGELSRLLGAAQGLKAAPERLTEACVAAVVAARLAGTQGAAPHGLATRDVGQELIELARSEDPAVRRFSAHAGVILAATSREDAELEAASRRALQVELSDATLEVIAAAWLSLGRMDRAITELERGLPRLAPSRRGPLTLSLASLELAVGAGREERGMLRKGLQRLSALEVSGASLTAERTYLQAVGGRVAAWLGSSAPGVGGPGASDEVALRGLLPLVDEIDPTSPRGGVVVAGATLSAGALGLALGSYDLAIGAFQIARRLELPPFMERLVVGQVALAAGDSEGAALSLDGAVANAVTASERFLAHKWRALAANRLGSMADARAHFQRMLKVWTAAKAPRLKTGRQPVALLLGGVEIASVLPPGGPARIQAVLTATPALAADFPHDRRRIQALLKGPKRAGKGR